VKQALYEIARHLGIQADLEAEKNPDADDIVDTALAPEQGPSGGVVPY
jgi:hypothetical protein